MHWLTFGENGERGEEIILEDNRAMNEFLDRIESGTVNNHNQINAVLNGIVVMKSQLASLESQFTAFAATQNQNWKYSF